MNLISESIRYIKDIIGISPEIKQLAKTQRDMLPYFINDAYRLHSCFLLEKEFIFLSPHENSEYTPGELSKHADVVRKHLNSNVVLSLPELTGYNRKRLIGNKTPFIVPGKQMYLPDLMIDLREHFKDVRINKKEYLSPSSQVVLLYCILNNRYSLFAKDLKGILPYTRMTLNRAFDELVYFELAEKLLSGRDKLLNFSLSGKNLWDKALPLFRSPVKKKAFVIGNIFNNGNLFLGGLSALAEYSMIAEGECQTYAVEKNKYQQLLRDCRIEEIPSGSGASAEVEIWSYAPELLSFNRLVDPLSLYLSLRDNHDERIQGELENMMEDRVW
jgi:hypothetical protein